MQKIDDKFRRRYRSAVQNRLQVEKVWEEIDYYTGPVKESGFSFSTPGVTGGNSPEDRKDLWDFTAIEGREKLSASIHGAVTSPAARWFLLSFRDAKLNRDQAARAWLDQIAEEVWADLQDSDFYTEIASCYAELCGPGNTFLAVEPAVSEYNEPKDAEKKNDWDGVDFTALPLNECFFEPDRKGGVARFWRRLMWTASQVEDFCLSRETPIPVPEKIQKQLEKGDDGTKHEIVFHVFPRPKYRKRKVAYPVIPELRPWGCVYWMEETGEQLGEEGGYYEQPVYFSPWVKSAGLRWGTGPGNVALPTVKYVNDYKKKVRATSEKSLDPPMLTTDRDLLGDVDIAPGGVTMVRDVNNFKVLEHRGDFNVSIEMIRDDQNAIRRIFHTDDLELKDSPAMTATEAQIRYEWMSRILGKTLVFIQQNLLGPVILTIVQMKMRLGAIPPKPESVKAADVNIDYQGPLARSQRTDEVAAIERYAQFIAGMAQFYPEIRAALDPVAAAKAGASRLGVPADIVPDDPTMRKRIKEILQSQAQAAQADSAVKQAKANKDNADAQAKSQPVPNAVYPQLPPKPLLAPNGDVA